MNPLDQLRDIHLPESVNGWPPAIGWWVLAAVLLALTVYFWKRYKNNKKRRVIVSHAMQSLKELEADAELNPQEWLQALSALLRRIVINIHGRQATAGLVGNQWLSFLDQNSKKQEFSNGIGSLLATQPYQEEVSYDRKVIIKLVRKWLKSQSSKSEAKASLGVNNA